MEFLETSDCTDESQKDKTCLQLKMKKHYIKPRKISCEHATVCVFMHTHSTVCVFMQSLSSLAKLRARIMQSLGDASQAPVRVIGFCFVIITHSR